VDGKRNNVISHNRYSTLALCPLPEDKLKVLDYGKNKYFFGFKCTIPNEVRGLVDVGLSCRSEGFGMVIVVVMWSGKIVGS
jgi:hypothetical protein